MNPVRDKHMLYMYLLCNLNSSYRFWNFLILNGNAFGVSYL